MSVQKNISKQALVMRELLRLCETEGLSAGAQLPTETQYAERFNVSRVTIRAALSRLAKLGWVRREHGRGTFLAKAIGNTFNDTLIPASYNDSDVPTRKNRNRYGPPRELGLLLRWAHPVTQPDLYHEEIIAGVQDSADAVGAKLNTWFIEAGETAVTCVRRILAMRGDAPAPAFVLAVVDAAESLDDWPAGVPLCCIEQPTSHRPISYIAIDNDHGAWLATRHLISLGRRRIALFGDFSQGYVQRRLRGYVRALEEAEIPFDPALVVDDVRAGSESAGADALRRLWERGIRPDGVFAGGGAALGVWRLCRETGVRAPEEISLVGLDGFPWVMARESAALTVVLQPFRAAAAAAVHIALGRDGHGPAGGMRMLRPRLVVRDTCGAARQQSTVEPPAPATEPVGGHPSGIMQGVSPIHIARSMV